MNARTFRWTLGLGLMSSSAFALEPTSSSGAVPVAAPTVVSPAPEEAPAAAPVETSPSGAPAVVSPAPEAASDQPSPVEAEPEDDAPKKKSKKRRSVAEVRLVNTSGSEAPPPAAPEVDPATQPYTHHLSRWEVAVGGAFVVPTSPSFDLFAARDLQGRFFARVGRSFALSPRWSFAVVPEWNVLSVGDGNVRSLATSLLMSEFSLGLELRYHFHPRLLALVRLSPGGSHTKATLLGGTATLEHESVHFHAAASVGAMGLIAGSANGAQKGLRLHGLFEAGFDWTPSRNLRFRPVESAPERSQNFDWAGFDMSAPFVSVGLALSY